MNFPTLEALLQAGLDQEVYPGAVAGWTNGSTSEVTAVGHLSTTHSPRVTSQTRYDVASVTKSLATSTLATWLAEQLIWQLDDPLIKWLPEYQGGSREQITIRDLLSFSIPFDLKLSTFKNQSAEEIWHKALRAPVSGPIGQRPVYTNVTSVLLGRAIEKAAGDTLPHLFTQQIANPLGLTRTAFSPVGKENTAPSEIDPWRNGEVIGETHDESAWKLRTFFQAGSAGLFSCGDDMVTYLSAVIRKAHNLNSQFLISSPGIHEWSKNVYSGTHQWSLGWELMADWMGDMPLGTFGKTGFTGCCVAINLQKGRAGFILSNATYPHRPQDRTELTKIRQAFCQLLLAEVL